MPWPAIADSTTDPAPHRGCGLGAADKAIWLAALADGLVKPTRLWWCNPLGQVPDWISDIRDPTTRNWCVQTWSKRPDVICIENGTTLILEIKPYASYVALGQALMYAALAHDQANNQLEVKPTILTDQADPDLLRVLPTTNIRIRQIGRPIADRPTRPT